MLRSWLRRREQKRAAKVRAAERARAEKERRWRDAAREREHRELAAQQHLDRTIGRNAELRQRRKGFEEKQAQRYLAEKREWDFD